jgi:Ca2+-binding RTX toxin-like protein
MAYAIVNGTSGNNSLIFQGIIGSFAQTLVNPYSGYTITITSPSMNINNAIYDGLGGTDTLFMTTMGDVLMLVDAGGTIMIKNVENINAGADGDIVILAHAVIGYGNVTIRGSDGDDILWSNNGNDIVQGGNGHDIIDGGGGDDILFGGVGNDYIAGGAGVDALLGGDGNDTLVYHADGLWSGGYTLASLGSAIPFAALIALDGKNRSHDIFHGDADETMSVINPGTDTLVMTSGDDVLVISDTLSPTNGLFTPRVSHVDVIDAGAGNDVVDLSGAAHINVTINGGDGNDVLGGSTGNDALNGDAGDDILFGAAGNDTLRGGTGNDTYSYRLGDGNDRIVETSGTDTLSFGAGINLASLTFAVSGADLLLSVGGSTITIENHFAADQSGRVETIQFADGSTYDLASYIPPAAPVALDDVYFAEEDTLITGSVLDNDSDENGDTLTVDPQVIETSGGGTVTLNADGTFTYVGAENFHGTESFSYIVRDGNGGSAMGNVTLNISPVNDAPVAVNDSFSGNEDEAISGSLLDNDSDVDGDALTADAETITTANGGSVTINADGTFSYTGAANFNGTDNFSYTVRDGNGGSAIGSVTLNVGAVNDAPVAEDDLFSGNEDAVITGSVLANDTDADGDALTVDAQTITTANGGTVTLNADGTFSYFGASNFHGADSFSYTARDGNGGSAIGTVLLSVAAVNDAPVARDDAFNGLMNTDILGHVLGDNGDGADSDQDGDALSVLPSTLTTAQGGTVILNADGSFTYNPAEDFIGDDSFDYTLADGNGGYDIGTVTLTVAADPTAILGTDGGDSIVGTSGDDRIVSRGGNDIVKGMDGNDTLLGGAGDDILYGDDSVLTATVLDKVFTDTLLTTLQERVNISNLNPSGVPSLGIANNNLHVDFDATASITFRKGYAGHDNSFGAFAIADDGTIVNGTMYWKNVKTAGVDVTHQIDLPTGEEGGSFGFFIIENGNNTNSGYGALNMTGEGNISFVYNYGKPDARDAKITDPGAKISVVYDDGVTVKVLKGNVYFTTDRGEAATLNKDGKTHVVSGAVENDLVLNIKKTDLAGNPNSYTKNGVTLTALTGSLVGCADNKVGIKSSLSQGGDAIVGTEALRIATAAGAEKLTIMLSGIAGGDKAIDLKIYLNGDMAHPVSYEYVTTSTVSGGKVSIVLDAAAFGTGLITAVDVSSVANSSHGTHNFYLENVKAQIPGVDTDVLRIGFEDLYNTGDADYEDVLFDLNINPVTVSDTSGGNDYLDGGAGNDTLYGGGGDDILVIGDGLDNAHGGAGADTFKLTLIDAYADNIQDFKTSEGDKIDISQVLEGYDPLSDDIADFVQLVQNGANTELRINADGDHGGAFATAAIILGGVGGENLASLVADGHLVA